MQRRATTALTMGKARNTRQGIKRSVALHWYEWARSGYLGQAEMR